jgi:hypothetical protein
VLGGKIWWPVGAALACAIAAYAVAPRAIEAGTLLFGQDDPALLADHVLQKSFDAVVAAREIRAALAAHDADLARSFLDLAVERNIPVEPELAREVAAAEAAEAGVIGTAGRFARGLVTGEPDDAVSLAGTAVGDLLVIGDIRDAVREGTRMARGEATDELILGLSCVGLAITAGTYASAGLGTPARIGLSVVKAARRTGRIGSQLGDWMLRSLRQTVDRPALSRALTGFSLTDPAVSVRAAREAVKLERGGDLVRMVGHVGTIQSKAGTKAALDGLKLAEGPRDLSRLAQLAERYGGKTRAVIKLGGRAAIWLSLSAVNLFGWLLAAFWSLFGFCASCKRAVERATERHLHRRKLRHLHRTRQVALAAVPV